MNVNPIIITALTPFGKPMSLDVYDENTPGYLNGGDYFTFNYSDERPVLYADDTDIADSTMVQVHYFTKGNPNTNIKAIRKALRNAGFSIVDTARMYEADTKYNHIIITVEIGGTIND